MADPDHLIREFQQFALVQKKLNDMIDSNIPKNEQITQIIDHIESANNFSTTIVKNILSNKIMLTENSLSIINHELKTPLVPIRAYADMLVQGKFGNLNTEQKEKVTIISASAKRLQEEIELLLDRRMLGIYGPDDVTMMSTKELKQQNMLLGRINQLLTEKNNNADSEIQKLNNTIIESKRQKNEISQGKFIMNKIVQIEEQKNIHLTKKNIIMMAMAALIMSAGFTAYSIYVMKLVGQQYEVSNLGNVQSGYVIQNLRGDTIDTSLSWRQVSGAVLHVGITNGEKYPEKIPLIKEVVLSDKAIEIDDSLLHKDVSGSVSTYYMGWAGALKQASKEKTQLYIPSNLQVVESSEGEGDINIVLSNLKSGDGYTGYTMSIADDSQNQILKSTITIYDVENLSNDQFTTILRHELGHAFGLAHSTAPEDLMHHVILTGYPYISDCDIDTIVSLYDGGKNSQVTCEK